MQATAARHPAPPTVALLLFASAREAAGTGRAEMRARTVGEVVDEAVRRYGPHFAAVCASSRIWANGEPVDAAFELSEGDEVAVLPPVSGGCGR